MVLFEPLQDADVGKAHSTAAFERQADFRTRARRRILLREQKARHEKQQDHENNSAHGDLLSGESKMDESRMNNEFGSL